MIFFVEYSILRHMILYTKFSCYQKGMINRKVDSLKNLNYTYFTVEDIKYNKKKKSKMIDKVDDGFYER